MHARRSTTTSPGSAQRHEGGTVHHCADASHDCGTAEVAFASFPSGCGMHVGRRAVAPLPVSSLL